MVGKVIGKGGSTILNLRDQCGCLIEVNQETKDAGYSLLKIQGQEANVKAATDRMVSIILELKEKERDRQKAIESGYVREMTLKQVRNNNEVKSFFPVSAS